MAIRKRTNAYWAKRSVERMAAAELASNTHLRQIYDVYEEARRSTVRSVQAMYATYYRDNGWDMAALKQIAPSGDIQRFLGEMYELGLDTRLPDNYKGRMSRLDLLNAQMHGEALKAAQRHDAIQTTSHVETIKDNYHRTIFDVAKGIGSTPVFSQLNTGTVDKILGAKFHGSNYSDRIWRNTDRLAKDLKGSLGHAVATGQSPQKTIREIRERYGVTQHEASRLVRTETAFYENMSSMEAYEEMGIKEWVFVATLDGRTSKICQDMDGKKFPVGGGEIPPLHPFCRSTTRPFIGKEYEPQMRIARDTDGKNQYVSNMTYSEWQDLFVHDIAGIVGAADVLSVAKGIVTTTYGAKYDAHSLWGISSESISDIVQQSRHLLEQYPQVQEWVKNSPRGGLLISGKTFSGRSHMGVTYMNKHTISISRPHFASRDKLIQTVFRGVKSGHFMPATKYADYVFTHEFGHLTQNYLLRGQRLTKSRAIGMRDDILKMAGFNSTSAALKAGAISKYGAKSPWEFFAEAFAGLHGGRPNTVGQAMGSYLEEML